MRKKFITASLLCFFIMHALGQSQKKISTTLLAQYNHTFYDRTIGNNPWSMGLGIQALLNNKTRFKPTIEITGDTYLASDKVQRINIDYTPVDDVQGMVNVLAGASYCPGDNVYLSLVAGPSFIGLHTYFGIKPSFGFYFSKTKRWTGKISFINVFNRDKFTHEDFGSLSVALGLRLF